ncbi:amidohydrolase [Paraglaciecola sp. L3A3]|uniref:amidohydrolase family protein n=1 Tax=Paraglaciecola sp. L3A3 TaxID=2686358 RepID=UPI00131B67E7|nr:amidohydrolase family protein [Paraglaciecola sp. L3A3]
MQRIDTHHHIWKLSRNDYHWLTPKLDVLYRDYLINDIEPILEKTNIIKTVLVQAADSLNETYFMLDIASKHAKIAGVIGWIDMLAEDALAQLQKLSIQPKFKGIRPMLQDISDPAWMLNDKLTPIFQALITHNLIFEALVKTEHLPYLKQLLERHPKLKVVINHGAKPNISSQKTKDWHTWIKAIAENHPVFCKLSGLVTEAQQPVKYTDISPYMTHILHSFGAERIMFGSDWPVINLASDYSTWIKYVERFVAPLSLQQQKAIWYDNAKQFYQL